MVGQQQTDIDLEMTDDQRRGEAWDYFLGGSDLVDIAEALDYFSVSALMEDIQPFVDDLTAAQKQEAALTMFIALGPEIGGTEKPPTEAQRRRVIVDRLGFRGPGIVKAAIENERVVQALEMRYKGRTYADIAAELGYLTKEKGNGYYTPNASSAKKAVQRALSETIHESAQELRTLHIGRTLEMLQSIWPAAAQGDLFSIDTARKLMVDLERLSGMDQQPINVNLSGSVGMNHSGTVGLSWEDRVKNIMGDPEGEPEGKPEATA